MIIMANTSSHHYAVRKDQCRYKLIDRNHCTSKEKYKSGEFPVRDDGH